MLKALSNLIASSMPPESAPRELEGVRGEICSLCGGLRLETFSIAKGSSGCLLILFFLLLYFLPFPPSVQLARNASFLSGVGARGEGGEESN